MDKSNEIRVIIIGKTGAGKSKTGNSIFGRTIFKYGGQASSISSKCQMESTTRFGKKIDVVDTPGVFDTDRDNETIQREVKRSIILSSPGPHAIILCIRVGRFTQEDIHTLEHYLRYFGEEMKKYVVIIFTSLDQLLEDDTEDNEIKITTGFIKNLPDFASNFLTECGNRYMFFNNKKQERENDIQVKKLIEIITSVQQANRNSCYTNLDYSKVEEMIQRRMTETNETRDNVKKSDDFFETVMKSIGDVAIKVFEMFLKLIK